MRHKAFTLAELLIVVVIIGVLATISLPVYQNVVDDSKAKVCEANLKAISGALEIYAMEHDTIPADLSLLPEHYLQKAYASLLKQRGGWRIKLAYFIVGRQEKGLAYAGLLTNDLTRGTPSLRRCPSAAVGAAISYGFNEAVFPVGTSITAGQYRAFAGETLVVGDSDALRFNGDGELTARHRRGVLAPEIYAIAVKKNKKIHKKVKTQPVGEGATAVVADPIPVVANVAGLTQGVTQLSFTGPNAGKQVNAYAIVNNEIPNKIKEINNCTAELNNIIAGLGESSPKRVLVLKKEAEARRELSNAQAALDRASAAFENLKNASSKEDADMVLQEALQASQDADSASIRAKEARDEAREAIK